jgi:hypothetical protein
LIFISLPINSTQLPLQNKTKESFSNDILLSPSSDVKCELILSSNGAERRRKEIRKKETFLSVSLARSVFPKEG